MPTRSRVTYLAGSDPVVVRKSTTYFHILMRAACVVRRSSTLTTPNANAPCSNNKCPGSPDSLQLHNTYIQGFLPCSSSSTINALRSLFLSVLLSLSLSLSVPPCLPPSLLWALSISSYLHLSLHLFLSLSVSLSLFSLSLSLSLSKQV